MLELPLPFKPILDKKPALSALVTTGFSQFKPVLKYNHQLFFEDYTDHGQPHIQRVLEAAAFLVTPESLPLLSPEDVAVLSLACLFHDLAMQFDVPSFLAMQFDVPSFLALLQDKSWESKWKEYCAEAKRWDEVKNLNVLGQTEPVELPSLTEKAAVGWTKAQKNLIGEFLRRHHTQLAKEICTQGFPLLAGGPIQLKGFDGELLALTGQVAESHGLDLRKAYDLVDQEAEDGQGLHLLYLMGLIRIADYLDLEGRGKDPAIKTLHSPFSRSEHRKHLAIKNVRPSERDPQSIQVTAEPTQVEDFLALQSLFSDLQRELDRCWACFGERYGAHQTLHPLGLRLRRVRSNLDDSKKFARTVDWVPQRLQWDVAGGEVMKLLVGPLYGEKPAVGIRELLQNSLDAVQEARKHLGGKEQHQAFGQFRPQEAEVWMVLEEKAGAEGPEWFFTISDQGIGMDLEVLDNYFLKAGASYRYSTAWKGEFQDEQGQSQVVRSGRFGVGAFAAFLLGHQIEVETRKLGPETGYRFSAGLENQPIQVTQDRNLPFGTQIKIRLHERAAEWAEENYSDSDWFWYFLPDPQVKREVRLLDKKAEAKRMKQILATPQAEWVHLTPDRAVPLEDTGFPEVLFFPDIKLFSSLFCNGIVIGDFEESLGVFTSGTLLVTDPNGVLPLNLTRDGLTQALPFAQLFRREIAFHVLTRHLWFGKNSRPKQYPALNYYMESFQHQGSPFYLSPEGLGLLTQFPPQQFLLFNRKTYFNIFPLKELIQLAGNQGLALVFGREEIFGDTKMSGGGWERTIEEEIQFWEINPPGGASENDPFWSEMKAFLENFYLKRTNPKFLGYNPQNPAPAPTCPTKGPKNFCRSPKSGTKWLERAS